MASDDKTVIIELGSSRINYLLGSNFLEDAKYDSIPPFIAISTEGLSEDEITALEIGDEEYENVMEKANRQSLMQIGDRIFDLNEEGLIEALYLQTNEVKSFKRIILRRIVNNEGQWDFILLKYIIQYLLMEKLNVGLDDNDLGVMFLTPNNWSQTYNEELIKLSFDELNFTSFFILDQSLSCIYGYGLTTGTIIDFGYNNITVTPIIENEVQLNSQRTLPIGQRLIDLYLIDKLNKDIKLKETLSSIKIDLEFIQFLKENNYISYGIKEDPKNLKVEPIEVEYKQIKFQLGKERYIPIDYFFNPDSDFYRNRNQLGFHLDIVQLLREAILSCDSERRIQLYENVAISGGLSHLQGFKSQLERAIVASMPASDNVGYSQPSNLKIIDPPDYLKAFNSAYHKLGFLGGFLTAKAVFSDPKLHISQNEFNQFGPSIVHNKTG